MVPLESDNIRVGILRTLHPGEDDPTTVNPPLFPPYPGMLCTVNWSIETLCHYTLIPGFQALVLGNFFTAVTKIVFQSTISIPLVFVSKIIMRLVIFNLAEIKINVLAWEINMSEEIPLVL